MRQILSKANVDVLAQLAWTRALLAFDFDGTLAPIVADREAAAMRPPTRRLFEKVCQLYPCAVVSGRAQRDVARRVAGAGVKYVIGNHGLGSGACLETFRSQVAATLPLLERALDGVPGVDVEDKHWSLAVHYRRSRRKRAARTAIDKAIAGLSSDVRVIPGKLVVDILPSRVPTKGDALLDLREQECADIALYVGDDTTDEDIFELDQPGRLLTIRVGASKASAASFCLRDQRQIDALLRKLMLLRMNGGMR